MTLKCIVLANAHKKTPTLPDVVHQGLVHGLAEPSASLVIQVLVARITARAEVVDGHLELVVSEICQTILNGKQHRTYRGA